MTLHPHEPSRANEIWKRFAGMFGSDAVERKFGATPPPEWEVMLRRLKDHEIDRGVKRLAYSGKAHVPTLPEFTRMCRELGGGEYDEGPQRPALPSPGACSGDQWEIEGNLRLMSHILGVLKDSPTALGPILPCREVKDASGRFLYLESQASKEQTAATGVLAEYKKAWSQDMREYVDSETGEIGNPPKEYRDRTWEDVIARAMAQINMRRAA
jgi:hypothetical protein